MPNNSICFYALIFNILRIFAPDMNISYREMLIFAQQISIRKAPVKPVDTVPIPFLRILTYIFCTGHPYFRLESSGLKPLYGVHLFLRDVHIGKIS